MLTEAEADMQTRMEQQCTLQHVMGCNMVITCSEAMESQPYQAPVGMTLTSTPVNSRGFIMTNVANIEQMNPLLIDFQLCSIGKCDHPRQQMQMEIQLFLSVSITWLSVF